MYVTLNGIKVKASDIITKANYNTVNVIPEEIEFYIDDVSYIAEEGMTWEDLLYNSDIDIPLEIEVKSSNELWVGNSGYILKDNVCVKLTDLIEDDYHYYNALPFE